MNFRRIKALNVRSEIIKIIEDDRGDYVYNIRMEKAFLHMMYVKKEEGESPKWKDWYIWLLKK